MATAEQEREYVAGLAGRSLDSIKRMMAQNEIPPAFVFATAQLVSDKELEAERKKDTSAREASDLARSANDLARTANTVASEANEIARDAAASARTTADAARKSNKIAAIALAIAIISIVASTKDIWLPYLKALL
jgi:hypothetical protein